MKRIVYIFTALLVSTVLYANEQGHFWLDVESQNIQLSNVKDKFSTWLDLPKKTTFTQFRDVTDELGIRHTSYQQYVQGKEIQDGMVLVHSKNGKVLVVNGDIMDSKLAAMYYATISPLKAAQKVRRYGKESDAELKIIRATIDGETVFRYAYEVWKEDFTAIQYVDAETGEIIKTVPRVFYADAQCTAKTMYNGTQNINCSKKDGKYYLMDEGRKIYTLDAGDNTYEINYNRIYKASDDNFYSVLSDEFTKFINNCSSVYNTTTTWDTPWEMRMTQFTVDNVKQNSKWYTSGEGTADLFIRLKDAKGKILYTSDYYNNPTLPVSFDISAETDLTNPPYTIEVLDYDGENDYDLIDTWRIEYIFGDNRTYDWKGSLSSGTFVIHSYGSQPLLDAHWGMEKTLDFYKEKLKRNSYDDQGSAVYNIVNPPEDTVLFAGIYANAYASSYCDLFPMVYGMGFYSSLEEHEGYCMKPLVTIDVMAHEFTHLVTDMNGNGGLQYLGEPGALNESFSDIIGITVKQYATGKNDWFIGSGLMINSSNMRSMKDPKKSEDGKSPQPDTYKKEYWEDTSCTEDDCDNGGVHTNSGVQNHWYYLVCEGGSGTNDLKNSYTVSGIGIDKAVQIAYRDLIYYLTPQATFEDSRNGSIQAAIDLYGKGSNAHQAVTNAWYAVGVGKAYVAPTDEDKDDDDDKDEDKDKDKDPNTQSQTLPYKETFAFGQGGFDIQNITISDKMTDIWSWDASYGMVAKSYDDFYRYASCSWLISPCIEIPNNGQPVVTFLHAARYFSSTSSQMSLWVSTDHTAGDSPNNSNWKRLTIPKYPTGYNWDWYDSGEISLSAYKGKTVTIGFKYTSTDSYAPQWRIKNFAVKYASDKEGIEDIPADPSPAQKIMRDGQIYILRGEKVYTLTGQEMK